MAEPGSPRNPIEEPERRPRVETRGEHGGDVGRGHRGDQPLEPRVPLPIRGREDREKPRRDVRRLGLGGARGGGRGDGGERSGDGAGREGGGIAGAGDGRRHPRRGGGGGASGSGGGGPAH